MVPVRWEVETYGERGRDKGKEKEGRVRPMKIVSW